MKYKVYLAKLKREDATPRCVYKIGITKESDAMRRLTYKQADEPYPISKYFPDIKIMKTVWCESRDEAERLEKHLMNEIRGDERWFHNWYERDQISGITEMRKWNYDEVQRVFEMMGLYENKGLLLETI
jgi:hypothetical protein